MRISARHILLTTAVLVAGAASTSTPSQAAGCGGYVNVFVSGCAPWDNNPRRLPGAPGYQPPRQISQPGISPGARPGVVGNPNARPGVIGGAGGGLISPGNRTGLVGNAGGTLISPGNRTGSSLIGNDSAGLISPGNRTGSSFRR